MKLVIVLCLFTVGEAYRRACSLRTCSTNFYATGNKDFQECLEDFNKAATCIEDTVKVDACQTCASYDFNKYTRATYIPDQKRLYCYRERCKQRELRNCMYITRGVLTYRLPSSIDDLTRCIESWTPELDHSTCLNGILMSDIPSSVDPVDLTKKILGDMRNGCDPVMPLAECRRHLIPLKNLYNHQERTTVEGMGKAIGEAYTCMQTAIKRYPCKAIEGLLAEPWLREFFVKNIPLLAVYDRGNAYATHCGTATANPRFLRYFEK